MGVHRVGKLHGTLEPGRSEVELLFEDQRDLDEEQEVPLLHYEWMGIEERDHRPDKILAAVDAEDRDTRCWALRSYAPATEEADECVQDQRRVPMLRYLEDRVDLPTKRTHTVVLVDRYGEATLSIDEAHYPLGVEREHWCCSFLLIVRTGRIFTEHVLQAYEGALT